MTDFKKILRESRLAGLAALAVFVLLRFWDPAPLEIARNFLFDQFQKAHPRTVADYPVTIVDIDDKSLSELGQWPWPRSILANLVDRLVLGGVVMVAFDIVFSEEDRLSPHHLAEVFPSGDGDLKRRLAALPDNDALFAESLKRARTVLARSAVWNKPSDGAEAARDVKASIATIGGDPSEDLMRVPAPLRNLPALESAASGVGMLTVRPERDGVIRRAPLVVSVGDSVAPGMAVEMLRVASGASTLVVKRDEAGVRSVVVAGVEIPSDRDGQLWVAFTPHDPKRYVSAASVLAGDVPRDRLEGKIAIVGTSAAGLFDLKSTPFERVIPGVEIHAQIIESILGGTTLNRPNFALGLEVALAVAIGAVLLVTAPLFGAWANLLIGAVIAALLAAAAWYMFAAHRLLIDITYPLASSFAIFLLMTFLNYLREEKRRTQVRAAFRQYLSPDLVEQLIREPGRLVLGGETREMSIMFSDVRGFTSIAETFKDNPQGLTALMNRMLTSLSHPIIERRGTIDKYIGDAIMAFWNAPLDDPDHAMNACETALEVLSRLDRLNAERRREGFEAGTPVADMRIGVGISTGLAVVGNMGSDLRFDYSVLGDKVNLASRLEGLTAHYGLRILVSAETARRCEGRLALMEVDRALVKGKSEPETIYTILGGMPVVQQKNFQDFQKSFVSMLLHYRASQWPEALQDLERCKTISLPGVDRLLDVYTARIAQLMKSTPAPDWDGVFKAWVPAA